MSWKPNHLIAPIASLLYVLSLCIDPAYAEPRGVRIGSELIVEPVEQVTTEELWHLRAAKYYLPVRDAGGAAVLAVWDYDSESGIRDEAWLAICLAIVGTGDVGETPVALRIWAKARDVIDYKIQGVEPGTGKISEYEVSIGPQKISIANTQLGTVFINGIL